MFSKTMWRAVIGAALVAPFALTAAQAQDTVKIGLIVPMTGGQASTGKQIDNAVKLYMQQHGDTVAGRKIEVILKDDATLPDNTFQSRPTIGAAQLAARAYAEVTAMAQVTRSDARRSTLKKGRTDSALPTEAR